MKESDFGVEIIAVQNGYRLRDNNGFEAVFEEKDGDELSAIEGVLWHLIEFFGHHGSKYDKERIHIRREGGERYMNDMETPDVKPE